jgi:hypothetical protein
LSAKQRSRATKGIIDIMVTWSTPYPEMAGRRLGLAPEAEVDRE